MPSPAPASSSAARGEQMSLRARGVSYGLPLPQASLSHPCPSYRVHASLSCRRRARAADTGVLSPSPLRGGVGVGGYADQIFEILCVIPSRFPTATSLARREHPTPPPAEIGCFRFRPSIYRRSGASPTSAGDPPREGEGKYPPHELSTNANEMCQRYSRMRGERDHRREQDEETER